MSRFSWCVRRGWRPFWTGGLDGRGYPQVLGLGSMFGVGGSGAGVVVSGGGVDVVDGVLLVVVCWWMDGVVLWGTGALVWWLGWGGFGLVGGVLALLGSAQLTAQSTTLHPTRRSDHSAQPSSRPIKNRGRRNTQDQDK